jgi:tetratricopeptide (TPR) repeat protein
MKKSSIFITAAFLILYLSVTCQNSLDSISLPVIEKANYKKDLNKALWENLNYPQEAFLNQVQGDVILSFKITSNGKTGDINVVSTPAEILSVSSILSLNGISENWNPCKVNGVPIDKTYLLVYRYRVLTNSNQLNYHKKADKLIQKEKFDKALKIYDKLLEDNKFDFSLFEKRAKTHELLGNFENANNDLEQALKLKNSVISTIDVNVISYKYTKSLGTTTVKRVSDF